MTVLYASTLLLALHVQVLTLGEAEQRAAKHQPALTQAGYAALVEEARAVQVRAALLPQIIAVGTYRISTANRAIRIGTLPTFAALSPSPNGRLFDYLTTGVTATQLLYDFGQSAGAWRSSRELAEAANDEKRAVLADTLLAVRVNFFNVRARKELAGVAREDFANQRRHLQQIQGFVDVKLRPSIDLAQAQADVGAAELRLLLAQNDYALANAQLGRAMGDTSGGDYDLAADEIPAISEEEESQDQLMGRATQQRADLSALAHHIRSDEQALAGARGGYGPALHMSVAATDAGPLFIPGPFDTKNLHWNYLAALTLTWPLFEGLRTAGHVREMESTLAQSLARRSSVSLTVAVEIETARRTIAAAKTAIKVADGAAESARERLRLAEGRYKEGVGTALELSDSQLGNLTAAVALVEARFNLATARAQLLHALGRDR